jgi:hypothetical protein
MEKKYHSRLINSVQGLPLLHKGNVAAAVLNQCVPAEYRRLLILYHTGIVVGSVPPRGLSHCRRLA